MLVFPKRSAIFLNFDPPQVGLLQNQMCYIQKYHPQIKKSSASNVKIAM